MTKAENSKQGVFRLWFKSMTMLVKKINGMWSSVDYRWGILNNVQLQLQQKQMYSGPGIFPHLYQSKDFTNSKTRHRLFRISEVVCCLP